MDSQTETAFAEDTLWDVIVVGTGMGGATAGYALARLGYRVLFVEKGLLRHVDPELMERGSSDAQGDRTGSSVADPEASARLVEGRWPTKLLGDTSFGRLEFYAPLGCGSGGSTALYAGALERFSPADFAPRRAFTEHGDSTLPDTWPIDYDELAPYYERAEKLFCVCGTGDPLNGGQAAHLREPPQMSARDTHLHESFSRLGLHPYRIHVACQFVDGCSGCTHDLCVQRCRRDAAWSCLLPALKEHGARILSSCEVVSIDADARMVKGVRCIHQGREIFLRSKTVVLAAGAYMTPVLLLKSASAHWPQGLANSSGWVGRNLMFHASDLFAVAPLSRLSGEGPQKTLAMNDFYHAGGEKLGTFQTLGVPITLGQIMEYIRELADKDRASLMGLLGSTPVWWRRVTSPVVHAIAMAAYFGMNFRYAAVWATIVEDLPYLDNRVVFDREAPSGLRFEYTYRNELKARVNALRTRIKKRLSPHRTMLLSGENNLNFAHVCGTCRFGDDPKTSVLNRDNRAHEIDNLYVVDGSFFPSSGGTNPSLTIAANALRVAQRIHEMRAI